MTCCWRTARRPRCLGAALQGTAVRVVLVYARVPLVAAQAACLATCCSHRSEQLGPPCIGCAVVAKLPRRGFEVPPKLLQHFLQHTAASCTSHATLEQPCIASSRLTSCLLIVGRGPKRLTRRQHRRAALLVLDVPPLPAKRTHGQHCRARRRHARSRTRPWHQRGASARCHGEQRACSG